MATATDNNEAATSFAQSIASLPPLPAVAQEILTCFGDEFIDAAKVASVVEGDPGICAKLLGLSNSAYFGLAEPVNTIGEAISRVLGVDTVRSLVLAMAIAQSFNSKDCPAFGAQRFWLQSLLTAECCKKIAAVDKSADDATRDLAYSAGLCHNIGLMLLAHLEPVRTNTVLLAHRDQDDPGGLSRGFMAEFATDHRNMTSELARIWSLPAPMLAAYRYRAYDDLEADERLGLIITAGIVAVENVDAEEDQRINLEDLARSLELDVDTLQNTAVIGERRSERVQSLASNMTA